MSNQDWDIFEVETGLLREIFGPESSANDAANCSTTLQCAVKNPGLINMFLPGSMLRSLQWHDLVITGDEDPCEIHGIQVEVGLQQAELWYCHYTFFSSLVLWCVCVCVYVSLCVCMRACVHERSHTRVYMSVFRALMFPLHSYFINDLCIGHLFMTYWFWCPPIYVDVKPLCSIHHSDLCQPLYVLCLRTWHSRHHHDLLTVLWTEGSPAQRSAAASLRGLEGWHRRQRSRPRTACGHRAVHYATTRTRQPSCRCAMQVGRKAHARFAESIQSFVRAAFGTAMLSELQMFRVVALWRLLSAYVFIRSDFLLCYITLDGRAQSVG